MNTIILILTCEDCGQVKHYNTAQEGDIDQLIAGFKKKHSRCNPDFFSYFTISKIPFQASKITAGQEKKNY